MTVLSGRASSGARSVLRAVYGTVFAIVGLMAAGCGNSTFTYGTPVITFSVTPGPFTSYLAQLYQIVLTRNDGTLVYPVTVPEMVDFTHLNDRTELFGAPAVIEGTYVSATITINYSAAQIHVNVNGVSQAVTILDAGSTTGATAGSISYTVKFDSAHPLVIKKGVSTPLQFNFDLSASSVLNTTTSPIQLSVRPVMTASTEPVYRNPLRARGGYVTADLNGSNFTINARPFFDIISNPKGAIQINTDANTAYNINGLLFKGADGLAAMSKLSINTMVEAKGVLGSLDTVKPNFTASEVYAGVSISNGLTQRIIGTVSARSGNTLTIHGAVVARPTLDYVTDETLYFSNDLPVTVGAQTIVGVDGQPEFPSPSAQDISVGQQVDIEGTVTFDTTTGLPSSATAATGIVRLTPTAVWGTLNTAGTPTVKLVSLGNYQPEALTFTGTGSATGADSDPNAYAITNSSTTDLSALPANTLVRFDGMVAPFGAAPPDLTATAAVAGSATDQVLVIDWINGGTAAPFVTAASDGLTVNMSDANLGTSHTISTGPLTIQTTDNTVDLKNPLVNPKIVADPSLASQFSIGNPSSSTGVSMFQSYSSYQTQIGTVLNGTNKIQKLVAVGKWDGATFTAYRIDMVQLP